MDSEIDAGERFDGPEPVLPCTMRHHTHHALVWSAVAALFFYDGFFWSAPLMTMFMIWYADAYTAVLHCALDRPGCLNVKILKVRGYVEPRVRIKARSRGFFFFSRRFWYFIFFSIWNTQLPVFTLRLGSRAWFPSASRVSTGVHSRSRAVPHDLRHATHPTHHHRLRRRIREVESDDDKVGAIETRPVSLRRRDGTFLRPRRRERAGSRDPNAAEVAPDAAAESPRGRASSGAPR